MDAAVERINVHDGAIERIPSWLWGKRFELTAEVPGHAPANVILPEEKERLESIKVNGAPVALTSLRWRAGKLAVDISHPKVAITMTVK